MFYNRERRSLFDKLILIYHEEAFSSIHKSHNSILLFLVFFNKQISFLQSFLYFLNICIHNGSNFFYSFRRETQRWTTYTDSRFNIASSIKNGHSHTFHPKFMLHIIYCISSQFCFLQMCIRDSSLGYITDKVSGSFVNGISGQDRTTSSSFLAISSGA